MAEYSFQGATQKEVLPFVFEPIKQKSLSSYLDREIIERLELAEPVEAGQSGSNGN